MKKLRDITEAHMKYPTAGRASREIEELDKHPILDTEAHHTINVEGNGEEGDRAPHTLAIWHDKQKNRTYVQARCHWGGQSPHVYSHSGIHSPAAVHNSFCKDYDKYLDPSQVGQWTPKK